MKVPIVFMRKAENDMKYAICYSSRTGNTGKLAEAIRQTLPTLDCVYCGAPHVAANSADVIFAGFWTDKGTCDSQMGEFLQTLENKRYSFSAPLVLAAVRHTLHRFWNGYGQMCLHPVRLSVHSCVRGKCLMWCGNATRLWSHLPNGI